MHALQAVVSQSIQLGCGVEMNGSTKGATSAGSKISSQIESLKEADQGLANIAQEAKYAVVDISSRSSAATIIRQGIKGAVLAIHGVKSLDDAIDLVGSTTEVPCLAAYHFSNNPTGKYLSQFIG